MSSAKFQDKYRIPSARLQNWDYSSNGYYFLTICTHQRYHYFGRVVDKTMELSEMGKIAQNFWLEIPQHFPFVILDAFVIMPNHMHGILGIDWENNWVPAGPIPHVPVVSVETRQCLVSTIKTNSAPPTTPTPAKHKPVGHDRFQNQGKNTISSIIGSYKSICTKIINRTPGLKPKFQWQPRFYDHIVRDFDELMRIRQYIKNNPRDWIRDRNNKEGLEM